MDQTAKENDTPERVTSYVHDAALDLVAGVPWSDVFARLFRLTISDARAELYD